MAQPDDGIDALGSLLADRRFGPISVDGSAAPIEQLRPPDLRPFRWLLWFTPGRSGYHAAAVHDGTVTGLKLVAWDDTAWPAFAAVAGTDLRPLSIDGARRVLPASPSYPEGPRTHLVDGDRHLVVGERGTLEVVAIGTPAWSELRAREADDVLEHGTVRCPCCRCLTLPRRANFDICPVCFWEDDGWDDLDEESGPNRVTLREGQANYLRFGACEPDMIPHVRRPFAHELPPT